MNQTKNGLWNSPLLRSQVTSEDVRPPEMLFGYLIGPFGALLASGIFTSQLQNYLTNVLKLDLGFLTTLQLLSTILIVAANLVVGQLIERTRTLAGQGTALDPALCADAFGCKRIDVHCSVCGPHRPEGLDRHCLQCVLRRGVPHLQHSQFHAGAGFHPQQQTALHAGPR